MKGVKYKQLLIGLLISVVTFFLFRYFEVSLRIQLMGAIMALMASWWITEAIHLSITALLPIILFPLFGIMDIRAVAPQYMSQIIFLFIGGFLLAFAIEKVNLHRRMALWVIIRVGTNQTKFLFGFMFVSYFLSMWILNTTVVILLLPALLSIIKQLNEDHVSSRFSQACLLGLAYSANIGGTTTLIGTAPNMIFAEFMESNFAESIGFFDWFIFASPVSIVLFLIVFLILKTIFLNDVQSKTIDVQAFKNQYQSLGQLNRDERVVLATFLMCVLLWLFRADIVIDSFVIKGWSNLFANGAFITDGVVAMVMAFTLFLIPMKGKRTPIISWKEMQHIPYDVIFLFGGGFALAKGVINSGLSELIAETFSVLTNMELVFVILILCLFMTFFTELTSNTASTQLVLPIVASLSLIHGFPSVLICLPIVFSASMAFMLPVATPPNTIVFGSSLLPIKSMIRVGLLLNVVAIIVITIATYFWGSFLFI